MNCPACGAAADADARFCEVCGFRIVAAAVGTTSATVASADRCELDVSPQLGAVCDRGRVHARNEDAVVVTSVGSTSILVVCDGVSTSHDAALGSRTAAEAAANHLVQGVSGSISQEVMSAALQAAHKAVCDLVPIGTADTARPLTTIVAALVCAGTATIGWVGDSRAYVLSDRSKLLTKDDSWVNWVVERGDMTEGEAMHSPNAHAITQCLGDPDDAPEPHIVATTIPSGEKLLLCSDGLWNYAPDSSVLVALLNELPLSTPAVDQCRRLVEHANAQGGRDNITAALLIMPGHDSG
jgi:serine/threonine protein phosphatase PrpC